MTTPNVPLSEVPQNSLQPSVPINDSLQVIDLLLRPGGIVQDKDLTTPPTTVDADEGKRWIIPAGATGVWSGKTGQIAACIGAVQWRYFTPTEGWRVYVLDEDTDYIYSGSAWILAAATLVSVQTVTSSATVTPLATNDKVVVTAQAAAIDFANPSGTEVEGQGFVIALKDNGTARAISWGTSYRAMGASLPTTTVLSKWMYIPVMYNATDDKWDVFAVSQQA